MARTPKSLEAEAAPEIAAPEAIEPEAAAPELAPVEPEPEVTVTAVVEVKARVLRDCSFGTCDDVVTLDAALVESLAGTVDADPAAVAYAESLAK